MYSTPSSLRAPNGTYHAGGVFNLLTSSDGATWSTMDGSPGANIVTGDANVVFAARDGAYNSTPAPATPSSTWTKLATPTFPQPDNVVTWDAKYDPDHHVLYSLDSTNGFWRMRTP